MHGGVKSALYSTSMKSVCGPQNLMVRGAELFSVFDRCYRLPMPFYIAVLFALLAAMWPAHTVAQPIILDEYPVHHRYVSTLRYDEQNFVPQAFVPKQSRLRDSCSRFSEVSGSGIWTTDLDISVTGQTYASSARAYPEQVMQVTGVYITRLETVQWLKNGYPIGIRPGSVPIVTRIELRERYSDDVVWVSNVPLGPNESVVETTPEVSFIGNGVVLEVFYESALANDIAIGHQRCSDSMKVIFHAPALTSEQRLVRNNTVYVRTVPQAPVDFVTVPKFDDRLQWRELSPSAHPDAYPPDFDADGSSITALSAVEHDGVVYERMTLDGTTTYERQTDPWSGRVVEGGDWAAISTSFPAPFPDPGDLMAYSTLKQNGIITESIWRKLVKDDGSVENLGFYRWFPLVHAEDGTLFARNDDARHPWYSLTTDAFPDAQNIVPRDGAPNAQSTSLEGEVVIQSLIYGAIGYYRYVPLDGSEADWACATTTDAPASGGHCPWQSLSEHDMDYPPNTSGDASAMVTFQLRNQ